MDYTTNHCWCFSSHWDGEHYNCRHIVSLSMFREYEVDWKKLIDEKAEKALDQTATEAVGREIYKDVPNFNPDVLKWLEDNVKDCARGLEVKGWCIGSPEYRLLNTTHLSVFFQRRKDAMAFIKEFSTYKKPIIYHHYFNDVRKKLNLETMKYEKY